MHTSEYQSTWGDDTRQKESVIINNPLTHVSRPESLLTPKRKSDIPLRRCGRTQVRTHDTYTPIAAAVGCRLDMPPNVVRFNVDGPVAQIYMQK